MDQDRYCGTCKHHKYEKMFEDWACVNLLSDYFTDVTPWGHTCEDWEEKGEEDA